MESRVLVRIDVLLGLLALSLLVACCFLVALNAFAGGVALVVVAAGLYALWSYLSGFLGAVDAAPASDTAAAADTGAAADADGDTSTGTDTDA
ncbi:hypothetical protein [Halobaculum sp. D14]|uniref:hypothetical protein n=1 Tax=unclassified Halobaculum TaxID=2640896 RepID=UPI003EBE9A3D